MGMRRVLAITRRSLSQFRHDRRTLGFVFIMPLLLVLTFGYTFGGEVHDVRTLVVNEDEGALAALLLDQVEGDTLSLETFADFDLAREEVEAGRAWAALHFPPSFSQDLLARRAVVTLAVDGTSPPILSALLGTLRAAAEQAFAGAGGAAPLSLQQEFLYGSADTRFIDSFAPGVVGLAILLVTTIFSVIVLVRERTGGTLERLFATPLRPVELVAGHVLALGVIAFFQSAVVFAAAVLLFQVQVVGSLVLAFVILLLFAVGNMGLGIVLSSAARNELQAVQFVPLILFPSILLTGVFFPLEAIPASVRNLSLAVPLTYANHALQSVMLRGWGLLRVARDLLVLLAYGGLTLVAAAVLVRRQA